MDGSVEEAFKGAHELSASIHGLKSLQEAGKKKTNKKPTLSVGRGPGRERW